MVHVKIICVGKIKEKFFREALEEYYKRLSAFCSLEVIEVKEERLTSTVSVEQVVESESKRLLEKTGGGYTVALDITGKEMTSEDFAQNLIKKRMDEGYSTLNFLIGGSHGLSQSLLKSCDFRLSFSEMTFPHQLFRVMFSEQLYRAFTVLNNQKYHK